MSSSDPTLRDEQTLSAYIDGELTAQEAQAVEAWLAEDSAARQLVDDLRTVSAALQQLPRQTLPEAWKQKLVERLDKSTVRVGTPAEQPAAKNFSPGDRTFNDQGPRLLGRSWRAWGWSAGAVAAALLITFLLPDDSNEIGPIDNNQIAQGPDEVREPMGGEIWSMETDEIESEGEKKLIEDAPVAEPLSSARAAGDTANATANDAANNREEDAGPLPPAPLVTAPQVHAEGISELELRPGMEPRPGIELRRGIESRSGMSRASESHASESRAPGNNFAGGLGDVADGEAAFLAASPASQPLYLIIWADVPEEVFKQQEINNVLVSNGIALDRRTAQGDKDWVSNVAQPIRSQLALRNRDLPNALGSFKGRLAAPVNRPNVGSAPAGETILVEATIEQIGACLAQMDGDFSNFETITVEAVDQLPASGKLSGASTFSGVVLSDGVRRDMLAEERAEAVLDGLATNSAPSSSPANSSSQADAHRFRSLGDEESTLEKSDSGDAAPEEDNPKSEKKQPIKNLFASPSRYIRPEQTPSKQQDAYQQGTYRQGTYQRGRAQRLERSTRWYRLNTAPSPSPSNKRQKQLVLGAGASNENSLQGLNALQRQVEINQRKPRNVSRVRWEGNQLGESPELADRSNAQFGLNNAAESTLQVLFVLRNNYLVPADLAPLKSGVEVKGEAETQLPPKSKGKP